jgi:hypothetical protein
MDMVSSTSNSSISPGGAIKEKIKFIVAKEIENKFDEFELMMGKKTERIGNKLNNFR